MNIKIVKNSATELIITQQKKLTVTGSMFCVPAIMLFFNFPHLPVIILLSGGVLLWMVVLHCFYRGVTYTFKANKTEQTLEVAVRSFFRNKKDKLSYHEIHHVLMAESDRFLKSAGNCHYHIIIETSCDKRLKLFGFKNRRPCKNTRDLIESYL